MPGAAAAASGWGRPQEGLQADQMTLTMPCAQVSTEQCQSGAKAEALCRPHQPNEILDRDAEGGPESARLSLWLLWPGRAANHGLKSSM